MALSKVNPNFVSQLGRRNLFLGNGDMRIAQRGTTKASLTTGYNCLDRVYTYKSHDGVVEESQSTDTPNSEFYNSIKHRVTTADSTIAGAQYHALSFRTEGQDVSHLGFGTSGAKKVTVSFWVKSSVAGAYGAALRNIDSNRFNQATMTINSADTWEKKSITYTGDTGGTWPKDNTQGFHFQLSMAMGTTYQGTSADTWVTNIDVAPSNQVNWLSAVGNTFYLTGMQVEEGIIATDFEHRSYGEELAACKRYYQVVSASPTFGVDNIRARMSLSFPVEMRGTPSVSQSAVVTLANPGVGNVTQSGVAFSIAGTSTNRGGTYQLANFSGMTESKIYHFGQSSGAALLQFDAEL